MNTDPPTDVSARYYESYFAGTTLDVEKPWLYYRTGNYPNVERYRVVFELIDALRLPRETRVLDIGCGGGIISRYLAERFNVVFASDITATPEMEAVLLERRNITFVRSCLPRLDKSLGGFGLIICSEVVEHLKEIDQPASMAILGGALAPNGIFVLSTPNPNGLVVRLQKVIAVARRRPSRSVLGNQPRENWLSPGTLSKMLPSGLVEIRRMGSYFVPPFEKRLPLGMAVWLYRLSDYLRTLSVMSSWGMYQYRVLRRVGDCDPAADPK